MIDFDALQMRYRPYPMGTIRPAFAPQLYEEFVAAFPDIALFERIDKFGLKYSLSEKYARHNYAQFVQSMPVWRELHRWIKSDDFILATLEALRRRHVDLGFYELHVPLLRRIKRMLRDIQRGRSLRHAQKLTTRFEFSMLPADGGRVIPHTDNPEKIVTLVVSMCREGEWSGNYGGGTDVVRPKDESLLFDQLNDRDLDFADVETVDSYSYLPNQVLMFVKTFNSWHAVEPMRGPAGGLMRKTLTINIEAR
ncbi:MAG: hypothetical protein ACREXT_09465 [Gammaproteobacteria bacterium]